MYDQTGIMLFQKNTTWKHCRNNV